MSNEQARSFLDSIQGYMKAVEGEKLEYKMATIDPAYNRTGEGVKVIFDGETQVNYKGFSWIAPYSPVAGDRVLLIPTGNTYVIQGRVDNKYVAPIKYAEFVQTGQSFTGSTSLQRLGNYTFDTARSVDGDFAVAGGTSPDTNSSAATVTIKEAGYYAISSIHVPRSGPGSALCVLRVNGEVISVGTNGAGYAWELNPSAPTVKVGANHVLQVTIKLSTTATIDSRIKIQKIA